MCHQAVDKSLNALEFVLECCKTQKLCHKAVNTYHSTIKLFLNAIEFKKCVIKLLIGGAF